MGTISAAAQNLLAVLRSTKLQLSSPACHRASVLQCRRMAKVGKSCSLIFITLYRTTKDIRWTQTRKHSPFHLFLFRHLLDAQFAREGGGPRLMAAAIASLLQLLYEPQPFVRSRYMHMQQRCPACLGNAVLALVLSPELSA